MKIQSVSEKNKKLNNKERISKPVLTPAYKNLTNTYLTSATNLANINKNLINHNISFKGNVSKFAKNIITNMDLPNECTEVICHDIKLNGSKTLKKITATVNDTIFDIENQIKGHVELNDSVIVNDIEAISAAMNSSAIAGTVKTTESIILNGFSKITTEAKSKYIAMFDSASIKKANAQNIEMKAQNTIGQLISDDNIILYGSGTIGDIECKGSQIFITGPVKINGKIKFTKPGEVTIIKDSNGKSAIIDTDRIENGITTYQVKTGIHANDDVMISKETFSNNLDHIVSEIVDSKEMQQLGQYKNISSIISSNGNNKFQKFTDAELKKGDLLYSEFAQNTLVTLAKSNNDKSFTAFWVKNKKIGNENLTEFWLKALGKTSEAKTLEEKTKIINNLTDDQKQKLIKATAEHWAEKVLPASLSQIKKTDMLDSRVQKNGLNILEVFKQGKAEELEKLLSEDELQQIESIKLGDKSIVNFWIDTIDGENSTLEHSERWKSSRLREIIGLPENIEKIYSATVNKSEQLSKEIKKAKEAYFNLINASDLDNIEKDLLKEYHNNQLFSLIVTGNAKDKELISNLESSTQSIIRELKFEKEKIIKDTADELFNPLKDGNYISKNDGTPELDNKIQLIMAILKEKIKLAPKAESEITTLGLLELGESLSKADDSTLLVWNKLVVQAKEYFENHQINRVVDTNIEQIYTVQKTLKKKLLPEVKAALLDKKLTPTQKEFITRHKDDNNLINLLKKDAVKRDEDIDGLIATEQLNHSVFDTWSYQFRKNISPETTKSMPEMSDLYIKLLGIAPNNLSNIDKYDILSKIPDEELEVLGDHVNTYWTKNFLAKTMSNSILEKVRNVDAGYQSAQMSQQLGNISVQIAGQQKTLSEISENFEHFYKLYEANSGTNNYLLMKMANRLDDIHADTSNIRTNIKVMLTKSIASTDDEILRKELVELLQDADEMSISKFINTVSEKQKIYKDEHRSDRALAFVMQNIIKPTVMVAGAAAAIHFAPALLVHGGIAALHGSGAIGGFLASAVKPMVMSAMISMNPKVGMPLSMFARYGNIGGHAGTELM